MMLLRPVVEYGAPETIVADDDVVRRFDLERRGGGAVVNSVRTSSTPCVM
jgi:hypothetical protein